MYRKTGKTDQNHRTLAKKHPNFRQGLQNLDLHECGFVCADSHVNITVYQPALSVDPQLSGTKPPKTTLQSTPNVNTCVLTRIPVLMGVSDYTLRHADIEYLQYKMNQRAQGFGATKVYICRSNMIYQPAFPVDPLYNFRLKLAQAVLICTSQKQFRHRLSLNRSKVA